MAQPSANDIHLHPGFEQVHRGRMPKNVGADAPHMHLGPTLLENSSVTLDGAQDTIAVRLLAGEGTVSRSV